MTWKIWIEKRAPYYYIRGLVENKAFALTKKELEDFKKEIESVI